jgi:hypothetical protein
VKDVKDQCESGLLENSIKQGEIWTATKVTFCPQNTMPLTARDVHEVQFDQVWQ